MFRTSHNGLDHAERFRRAHGEDKHVGEDGRRHPGVLIHPRVGDDGDLSFELIELGP